MYEIFYFWPINDDDIDDEEFCPWYDLNRSREDYGYSRYGQFDLEDLDDATSWSYFRFYKPNMYSLWCTA